MSEWCAECGLSYAVPVNKPKPLCVDCLSKRKVSNEAPRKPSGEMSQAHEYLRRAFEAMTFNPATDTDIEAALARKLDEASAYSELYEALEEEMSEFSLLLPDPVCQKGLVVRCRCEKCRHERSHAALAHARGER